MKLANFIANYLAEAGLTDVFMLGGGMAMHLNDALGKHPKLNCIFNHHEQASAMAAESYSRLCGKPAVVNITAGPGAINTLNGVFGAWTDSIPMIVISGQARLDTTMEGNNLTDIRQLGEQECDIVSMVKGITKYAVMLKNSDDVLYHLQKAIFLATHGRPGPVWLDIPINLQGINIDESNLREFSEEDQYDATIPELSSSTILEVIEKIKQAERPVILAGSGIRISGAYDTFLQLLDKLQIPVTTAWNAHDVLYDAHPSYIGRPGSVGDRAGNFAVQNADLLLVLGSRLYIRQISYNWKAFAREAYKIVVDIDAAELRKPTVSIDYPIHADVANFMKLTIDALKDKNIEKKEWMNWCLERRKKYPVVLPEYWLHQKVNPYCFMQTLSELLPEDQAVVSGDGTACVTSFQSFIIKKGTRLYTNSGSASMGYDIPGAIGAHIASSKKIVCLAGDGSAMQNIQELAVIAFKKYPIKIFLLNNQGYHSIRQTQRNFFGEPLVGVGEDSGLGFPNFKKLAEGFDIAYSACENHATLQSAIKNALANDGPHICEVFLSLDQQFAPKTSSKRLADGRMVTRPLEDLAPFLSTEELESNMLVPTLAEV